MILMYTRASGGDRETGLGEKVVFQLAESIKGNHHHLYFDNYFSSVSLLSKLFEDGTYACGTVCTNRKLYPSEISEEAKRFNRGQSTFRQYGNLVATAWKDKKVVNVISTLATPSESTSVQRWQKDGTRLTVECPPVCSTVQPVHGGC